MHLSVSTESVSLWLALQIASDLILGPGHGPAGITRLWGALWLRKTSVRCSPARNSLAQRVHPQIVKYRLIISNNVTAVLGGTVTNFPKWHRNRGDSEKSWWGRWSGEGKVERPVLQKGRWADSIYLLMASSNPTASHQENSYPDWVPC